MRGRSWAAVGGILLSLALSATAEAQTYTPGARTLGDKLPELRHLGNGGLRRAELRPDAQVRPGDATRCCRARRPTSRCGDAEPLGVLARLPRPQRHERHDRRRPRDVHARRRRPPTPTRPRRSLQEQADRHAGRGHPLRPHVPRRRRLHRRAAAMLDPGRLVRGLAEDLRRRVRRQRADGRHDLVPEQQPSRPTRRPTTSTSPSRRRTPRSATASSWATRRSTTATAPRPGTGTTASRPPRT